jgi:large conductance mechanosensitive channel
MGFLKEFKEFAVKGNVIDLAVGVVIGGAFHKVVDSVVNDVIMPPVGLLIGGVDFSKWKIGLGGDAAIKIGIFINTIIQFLIIAFTIFMVVKFLNAMKRRHEEHHAATKEASNEEKLLTEIRDLLKSK